MKKYKEWLRDRLESLRETDMRMRKLYEPNSVECRHFNGRLAVIDEVLDFIDELDEPEVLSQKWIEEHGKSYTMEDSVEISDLQNLLVPKQELPVIPKYVAEYLDFAKKEASLIEVLVIVSVGWPTMKKEFSWILANSEIFARAWLDGYEVEKEQKYYVLTSSNKILLIKDDGEVRETHQAYSWIKERDKEHYQLTEQEIRDYDEQRYWPFAVPVEELEE